MGRPREHDEATRVALLAAAERLIQEHGPGGVSVRTVAEAAGTTTRAVYSVFGSKAGLLEALATHLFQMLTAAVGAVPLTDNPAADVVAASIDGFRRVALEHPSLYSLVFERVVPDLQLGPSFSHAATAAFTGLESLLGRVKSSGGLGRHSVHEAAQAVHALTEGLASVELRGELGDPDQARRLWQHSIAALLRGLAAPAADDAATDRSRSPRADGTAATVAAAG